MKEFITKGYSYNELSENAKENVKRWCLDDETRTEIFHESILEYLKEEFPRSELKVAFSLSYCQGNGLNIYGKVNMFDFLDKWNAPEDYKKIMENIFNNFVDNTFTFEKNNHYCYSCKFIDKKYIDNYVGDTLLQLSDNEIDGTEHKKIIEQFYIDTLDYFEDLDKQFEKNGYEYLYNCDDEEVQDFCEANDYYFDENGEFIG